MMWTALIFLFSSLSVVHCQPDVRLPPTILQSPEKHYVYREDDKLDLVCKAYGIPEVDYEWKKNGFDLNLNANNIRRTVDGTIAINPVTSLDQGYYQCISKNQYGTAISNTSYLQKAIHTPSPPSPVLQRTVAEGEPFHIQAQQIKSVPPPTYDWEIAVDTVDKTPVVVALSKRVQVADNGDLYFAYALVEDSLNGKIYKSTAFNEYLDLRSGGSYTSVSVRRVEGGPPKFAPTIGFYSPAPTVAVEGREVSLRCFFSGNPEPSIEWSGPKNALPTGRYMFLDSNSKLTITNVQPIDEGDYRCAGSNEKGRTPQTLQIRVEAEPRFLLPTDRPRDTNITEGRTLTFNCRTYARPEATVVWYRNGVPIDLNSPPKRYVISGDKKTLTIQNLCRNCDDRPDTSQSDLGIIQCNASNAHGYAFGAGYVNVLMETKVLILGEKIVEVKEDEDRLVEFACQATSDPLTPVTPKWYKKDSAGLQLVYEEPPIVGLREGVLTIHVIPNNTQAWRKYAGVYRCTANNSYSDHVEEAELKVKGEEPAHVPIAGFETYWWILLLLLLILLIIIIICCCCICLRRNRGDNYDVDEKERKNGNDPEKELKKNDFQDYQRPEAQTLRGSRGSLGSAGKLNSDDEASLLEYGDDPGKFTEDGSFVGAYASNTTERGRGRRE